ncbi:UNVERIFIED_CONTAM: lysophospholipid acyltransferase, partial [Siphonaria sp. JEL0065]
MATFAWSVYDGTRPSRELSKTQQSLKIDTTRFPSLIDYLGFIFFYPAFILGPSFDFQTYNDFINGTGDFKLPSTQKMLPGRWTYLYKTIFIGACCSLIHIVLSPKFPYEYGLEDAFLEWGFLQRSGYFLLASLIQQSQFFGAWKLAEGACVLCGFGYFGPDGSSTASKSVSRRYFWNRCENVRIWELEFPENPRMFM